MKPVVSASECRLFLAPNDRCDVFEFSTTLG
jgi:hypothetical protein